MPLPPLREPMSGLRWVSSTLSAACLATVLFGAVMLANSVQMSSLLVWPFSRRAFRRINRTCADRWWALCVAGGRWTHGIDVVLTGDDVPVGENVMVVCNHQSMPDITFLMFLAIAKRRLGDMKYFVKKQLAWVPGVGWGMLFLDCIFVARDWASDADTIRQTFARINDGKVPIWLISFSEGTRMTARKLAAAQAFARERGLREPRHVLVPRPKGFTASVEGLRNHLDAVYDVTIGYVDAVPSLWQYARGLAPRAHLHVRRYPICDLPEGSEALDGWLRERFYEKDDLLEGYYQSGSFPESG
jgi:1-acyl-sn-glycerol-3-phosphate acyltransferase